MGKNLQNHDYAKTRRSAPLTTGGQPPSGALPPPTVDELTAALDELLDALMQHRRRARPPEKIECYSFQQLMNTPDAVLAARDRVADPVGFALYAALKKVARLLAAEVSMDDLQRLVERHGEIDPRRLTVLDHAFDGSTSRNGALWVA